jgi:hypothetical protein
VQGIYSQQVWPALASHKTTPLNRDLSGFSPKKDESVLDLAIEFSIFSPEKEACVGRTD